MQYILLAKTDLRLNRDWQTAKTVRSIGTGVMALGLVLAGLGLLKSAKGVPPTYSYPGPQYDADGVSVGAVPAYHAGKGVWCGPAYTNLLQNTACVGAVSGTPGTTPTTGS